MANMPFGKPSQILVGNTLQNLTLMLTEIQFHDLVRSCSQASTCFLYRMENKNRGLNAAFTKSQQKVHGKGGSAYKIDQTRQTLTSQVY